jgi:hypothetical protein
MRIVTTYWATIRPKFVQPSSDVFATRHKRFSGIDPHFPELQYHGLATFHKPNLYAITFYEPVFAWQHVVTNTAGNVITEFTAVPGNHVGMCVDYHPRVCFNPSRQKGLTIPNKKMARDDKMT